MHFPKLSPLQSRLAASMTASVLLLFVCCFLLSSHFADASDVDSIHPEDHNHQRLGEGQQGDFEFDSSLESTDTYEPEFLGVNRGIIGRAPDGVVSLVNNVAQNLNINPGWTDNWMFSKDSVNGPKSPQTSGLPSEVQKRQNEKQDLDTPADLESSNAILDDDSPGEKQILKARQGNTTMQRVWITVNTCLQPSSNTSSGTLTGPPQLELYVSVDGTNQKPGPDQDSARQAMSILDGGYGSVVIDANTDIYIGISAPESSSFNGIYNYDVAASIDAPYHSVNETNPFLFLIDSDSSSALLITNNLTQASEDDPVFQEWTKISPPFNLFAQNQNNTAIFGLQNSYCGLKNNAQVTAYLDGQATHNIDVGITTRGLGNKPKQQFYLKGLNDSSSYYGFLSMQGNSTAFGPGVVGGGGKVWKSMNFTTKSGMTVSLHVSMALTDFTS
jgi:calcium channel MID1